MVMHFFFFWDGEDFQYSFLHSGESGDQNLGDDP